MSALGRAGGVLRGMNLEPQALCVGRVRVAAVQPTVSMGEPERDLVEARVHAELQRLRGEAEQEGYAAGMREGRAAAAAQADTALQRALAEGDAALQDEQARLKVLAASLQSAREDMLRLAEEDAVALCFEVLCRVLGESAPSLAATVAHWRAACGRLASTDDVSIHLHPSDAELLAADAQQDASVRWVADPDVALGGCIVRHAGGGLDLRFETALAGCRQALAAQRERRRQQEAKP